MPQTALPAELILHIIECLIPSDPPVIFTREHEITHTLLNLTLVCKLVSRTARQLLLKHCLQIDSRDRLDQILQSGILTRNQHQLPTQTSLFLSPYPREEFDVPATVHAINTFSTLLCTSLTRLVIDIPLRPFYLEQDFSSVCPILRSAFSRMTALQEFTSVRDDLFLEALSMEIADEEHLWDMWGRPALQPMVWSFWPNLRKLALFDVAVDRDQFLIGLRECKSLTHLVLVRPYGLAEEIDPGLMGMGRDFLPKLERLIIVNTGLGFLHTSPFDEDTYEASFVGRLDALRRDRGDDGADEGSVASYLSLRMPFGRDDEDILICQEWLARQAVSGKLWGASDERQDMLQECVMRDTLRRHWQSCSVRVQKGQAIPDPRTGGKQKHACDNCARRKRSCSEGRPCTECLTKGRPCSNERLGDIHTKASAWSLSIRSDDSAGAHAGGRLWPADSEALKPEVFGILVLKIFYASADVCYRAYGRLS
ncbi:hypothetical protein BDW69DRAFT_194673 [Aspergillus filifer]